jgi:hypothetical protein
MCAGYGWRRIKSMYRSAWRTDSTPTRAIRQSLPSCRMGRPHQPPVRRGNWPAGSPDEGIAGTVQDAFGSWRRLYEHLVCNQAAERRTAAAGLPSADAGWDGGAAPARSAGWPTGGVTSAVGLPDWRVGGLGLSRPGRYAVQGLERHLCSPVCLLIPRHPLWQIGRYRRGLGRRRVRIRGVHVTCS